jgi:hypothetical protein
LFVTVRLTVVVAFRLPLVPVMVMVRVPVVAVREAVNVSVELPLAPTGFGLKLAVTPLPMPEAESVTDELKPPLGVTVIVSPAVLLLATDTELLEDFSVKLAVAALVTVNDTVVVAVWPPPVAVTVTLNVPVVAVELAVNVSEELPEPGDAIDVGLKLAVTPLGRPLADSDTAEFRSEAVVVIVTEALLPSATDAEPEDETDSEGCCVDDPVSAANRPAFGLPHPVTRSYPVTAE